MYPVVKTINRNNFIRVHGHAARRAFNQFKIPITFGKKHSLKNLVTYNAIGHKTFDDASLAYRKNNCDKVKTDLWFFMHIDFVKRFQKQIPGLIVEE